MQRVPLISSQANFEDLSDHDEGNKAFDKDVEEGDDDEAEARNMNDGFAANNS